MDNLVVTDEFVINGTPPELKKIADEASLNLLPEKSRKKYLVVYEKFTNWRNERKAPTTENVLLAYFNELSTSFKPSSLWSVHSMLKSTLKINVKIDIPKFSKLLAYLKRINEGYTPTKAHILSDANIGIFLHPAL